MQDFYESTLSNHSMINLIKDNVWRSGPLTDTCKFFFRISKKDISMLGVGAPSIVVAHGSCVLDRELMASMINKLRRCDAVVVTCESDVEILKEMISKNSPVIILVRFPAKVVPQPKKDARKLIRDILNIPKDSKIITMIGRIIPHKNPHVFIKLVKRLNLKTKVHGVLVGDYWGDYEAGIPGEAYRKLIYRESLPLAERKQFFRFDGGLEDIELGILFSGSDLIYHPTLTMDENFGFVAIEALKCKAPIIASAYGGIKESITPMLSKYSIKTWCTSSGPRADFRQSFQLAEQLFLNDKAMKEFRYHAAMQARLLEGISCEESLIAGLVEVMRRFNNGEHSYCCCQNNSTQLPFANWAQLDESSNWRAVLPSILKYTSFGRLPSLNDFSLIKIYPNLVISGSSIVVSDYLGSFKGTLSASELAVLNYVRSDWMPIRYLPVEYIDAASRLLQYGIVVGSNEL